MPEGLVESQRLPEPLFTPSTKAEQGAHDENISPEQGKTVSFYSLCRVFNQLHQLLNLSAKSSTTKYRQLP